MPGRKISVPVTPDMQKTLDELCEQHALQLPSLASMLLRDALAGRRSALLPKRAPAPQKAGDAKDDSEPGATEGAWALTGRRPNGSAAD